MARHENTCVLISQTCSNAPPHPWKSKQILENQENKIVINLDSVDYISSAGLRIFLMAGKKLKTLDGSFVLANMNEHIKEVFDISGFTPIFNIAPDNASAIKEITANGW